MNSAVLRGNIGFRVQTVLCCLPQTLVAFTSKTLTLSSYVVNPMDPKEAVKWLYKASVSGHVRAQYQLALTLHKGHGPKRNLQETV